MVSKDSEVLNVEFVSIFVLSLLILAHGAQHRCSCIYNATYPGGHCDCVPPVGAVEEKTTQRGSIGSGSIQGGNAGVFNSDSPAANQLPLWAENNDDASKFPMTAHGIPYPQFTASQAIGSRGHILLQDVFLLEKTQAFNRERIPERVVHAKGAGAFGHFTVTHDISHLTKADFLNTVGKKTRVGVRFSTVGGELGSADTWIDPKGFAVKFYTTQGIHDLVGNNIQVFPIRDPMLFTDLNHSRKRNPQTHLRDVNPFWNFVAMRPETTHHTLHLFSDMGTPQSLTRMDGAGVHTFKMVNADQSAVYVKFHWKTNQEKKHFTRQESAQIAGSNADYMIQDLFDTIERKDFPSWGLHVQVMTLEQAEKHYENPFDITTFWRPEDFPLQPVGTMVLDENPKDYFTQVEQIAFSPSHMVPGIEPSPDRMLHARMFSYPDSQLYRLGVNFPQLPVNRCPFDVTTYQRDGAMNFGDNGAGSPNYFPNSYKGLEPKMPYTDWVPQNVDGAIERIDVNIEDAKLGGESSVFKSSRMYLEKDVSPDERQRIVDNIADFLGKADKKIQSAFMQNIATPLGEEFRSMMQSALAAADTTRNK